MTLWVQVVEMDLLYTVAKLSLRDIARSSDIGRELVVVRQRESVEVSPEGLHISSGPGMPRNSPGKAMFSWKALLGTSGHPYYCMYCKDFSVM